MSDQSLFLPIIVPYWLPLYSCIYSWICVYINSKSQVALLECSHSNVILCTLLSDVCWGLRQVTESEAGGELRWVSGRISMVFHGSCHREAIIVSTATAGLILQTGGIAFVFWGWRHHLLVKNTHFLLVSSFKFPQTFW